jgi:NADH-quinone oxidoreductase subunit G
MFAGRSIHEPPPPADADSPLSFSMEGSDAVPPAELLANYWTPSWNSHNALNKFQDELGPDLENCASGVRLIEGRGGKCEGGSAKGEERNNEETAKSAFMPPQGGDSTLILPAFHIFGSEELSAMSPPVAELTPAPYVALNETDATKLALHEGDLLNIRFDLKNPTAQESEQVSNENSTKAHARRCVGLALRIVPGLPSGLALVPSGIGDLVGIPLPAWGQIEKAAPSDQTPVEGGAA